MSFRDYFRVGLAFVFGLIFSLPAVASSPMIPGNIAMAPHKALYNIELASTRSGSQILNISGKMFYEWKPKCDAWSTDHRFNLSYEYADSPGMQITSDFSTYEMIDGSAFDFTSRRKRGGALYEELRGHAEIVKGKPGEAIFSVPKDLSYDLEAGSLFPMGHTIEMIRQARAGNKFFSAKVFDGSDGDGPVEINTFIGSKANPLSVVKASPQLDMGLINTPAWNIRMAVFPLSNPSENSDYEMSMVFHDNGVVSDMLIEYGDFSVRQKLVAIEKLEGEPCGAKKSVKGGLEELRDNKENTIAPVNPKELKP